MTPRYASPATHWTGQTDPQTAWPPRLAHVSGADIRTHLGVLALVPAIRAEAEALVTRQVQAAKMAQGKAAPPDWPLQLHTLGTDLYWAPWDMQTGRLILWCYRGDTRGVPTVTTWTFTAEGTPVALSDILAVDKQDALDRINKAWTAHDRCLNPDDWDDFLGMTDDEIFTEGLGLSLTWNDIVAWNPTLRFGSTGLLITLFPTKRMHPMGVQEFFAEIPLQCPEARAGAAG